MTRYSLDTNIVSDLFRNPDGAIDHALRAQREHEIGISMIVKGEITFGLKRKNNLRGLRLFDIFLETVPVWHLEPPMEDRYAEMRLAMELMGVGIGPNDLWIASQAAVMCAVVVTDNQAFSRVPGLKVENWLRDFPADHE